MLIAVLGVVSVNAVAAGYGFIGTPDGSALGIPKDWLAGTPFPDYRVPGILLFSLGLLYGFAAFREVRRGSDAWVWAGLSGGAMIAWIIVQAAMMGSFRHPIQTLLQAIVLAAGLLSGASAFLQFRAWHHRWGATDDEFEAPMDGDEYFPRPSFNPTRAVTINASPSQVWPWIVQMGYGRAGFYSYDLLDNKAKPSLKRINPELQQVRQGDWVPMSSRVNETMAFRVAQMDPPYNLVWRKPDSTWAWKLVPLTGGKTRLITRIRLNYAWRSPLVILTLLLMEIGDFVMMRKCLLGIKERAEALPGGNRVNPMPVGLSMNAGSEGRV